MKHKKGGHLAVNYAVLYAIPFFVLFNEEFWDERMGGNFSEPFNRLLKVMNVKIDYNWLAKHYDSREHGQGDVHVFFTPETEDFIMLDLYFGWTDQSDMIVLGVRTDISKKDEIEEAMQSIYDDERAIPKSKYNILHNNELLHRIDISRYPLQCETNCYQNIFYHRA